MNVTMGYSLNNFKLEDNWLMPEGSISKPTQP